MSIELLPPTDDRGDQDENSKSEITGVSVSVMPRKRPAMNHVVRVLSVEETEQLAPIFEAQKVSLPDPAYSFIVGALKDGKVTNNFLVAQLRLHAEPLHLEAGSEHLFRLLVRTMYKEIAERLGTTDVYLFAPDGMVSKMAETAGMEREPWNVYSTTVYANPIQHVKAEPVSTEPVSTD